VTPTFSIVVPTYNRPGPLANCLAALAQLDYPADRFDVIVVDDGGTCDLSQVFGVQRPIRVNRLRTANAGPGAARNHGGAAATHQFLAFTDDDCVPRRDWLRQLAAALSADGDVLAGGQRRNAVPQSLCATASQMIIDVANSEFNHDHQHAVFFPSDNLAVARDRFMQMGGFDASFRWSEDRDLCDRWSAQGRRLVFVPEAIVDHFREMDLWAFTRQHVGYGRGAWRFHRARRRRNTGGLTVNGRFYLRCFRRCWIDQPVQRALALTGLLCVWQLANATGFCYEAVASRAARASQI
jgi:GT2 family glycosyltransferase